MERPCIALSEAYFRDGAELDVYGVMVRACAERLGLNAGSVGRALARAAAREREDSVFHEQRLDPKERLATLEAGSQLTNKVGR